MAGKYSDRAQLNLSTCRVGCAIAVKNLRLIPKAQSLTSSKWLIVVSSYTTIKLTPSNLHS